MNVHHLPDIATSRSHINRCKCLWLECPYDIQARALRCPHLPSNPSLKQQASKSEEQRSVLGAANNKRLNTAYGGRMWQGQHHAPKRNSHFQTNKFPTEALRKPYGNPTELQDFKHRMSLQAYLCVMGVNLITHIYIYIYIYTEHSVLIRARSIPPVFFGGLLISNSRAGLVGIPL